MRFEFFPWGLIISLLLGVFLSLGIILFYILRSHYTEYTVNSTYIWTLSEKFRKKKNPLSGLTGIISLILQLLLIMILMLALAHPIFVFKNMASRYCFVLDASESMNFESDGQTRFERAKEEIEDIISSSKRGSQYSLIYVSGEATMLFEGVDNKKSAKKLLSEIEPSNVEFKSDVANRAAQEYFDKYPGAKIYFLTDKNYQSSNNIKIINVSGKNETNFGLSSLNCEMKLDKTGAVKLYVDGLVASYKDAGELVLELYLDEGAEKKAELSVSLEAGQEKQFVFEPLLLETPSYSSVKVKIASGDSLQHDNEVVHYNQKNEKQYKTIIVSETPFFLQAAIDSLGDYDVLAVTPEEYEALYQNKSYGLYIFDSYTPNMLPQKGSVWMINSQKSLEGTGFTFRSAVEMEEYRVLEKSTSSQTTVRKLLNGIVTKDIYLINYLKYSTYGDYMTLLSCDGSPMVMAGENSYGNRMVVFAFSLHDSNIAVTGDFVNLVSNLLGYSFPNALDSSSCFAGDKIIINTVANADSVKLIAPSGNTKYLNVDETMNTVVPNEVGTYTVEVVMSDGTRTYSFYSEPPKEERVPYVNEGDFELAGEPGKKGLSREFDPSILFFILIIFIFAADWAVYMYEKRQLR